MASETIGSETLYDYTDDVHDNLALYLNGNRNGIEAALRAAASARVVTVASMTGNVTLTNDDLPVRSYSPTAARDLTFPAAGSSNHAFYVINRSSSYIITLKTSGAVVFGYVAPGQAVMVVPDGTNGWYPIYASGAWQAWTPTRAVSGGTVPTYTATDVSRYIREGNKVTCQITWINSSGGTAGVGSNALTFTLPVTASSSAGYVQNRSSFGMASVYENGGTDAICSITFDTTTTARFTKFNAFATIGGADQSSTDRHISGSFSYEAA